MQSSGMRRALSNIFSKDPKKISSVLNTAVYVSDASQYVWAMCECGVLCDMCPHTAVYVCPHAAICVSSYCYICVLILPYMCPHAGVSVSSCCYMCPHTAVYVSSHCCICVLILPCVLILLHMCVLILLSRRHHTAVSVSAYDYIHIYMRCSRILSYTGVRVHLLYVYTNSLRLIH